MPDYYRLYDRLRGFAGRFGYVRENLRAVPGRFAATAERLRGAPAEVRRWQAPGGFPVKGAVLAAATIALAVVAGGRGTSPSAPKPNKGWFGGGRSTTPADVQGRWVMASSGPTHYWSQSTGVFQGSGRGISQIYEFDADGNYKTFVYMEVRTDYTWTKMNNRCQGTVEFKGDRVTFHATEGHFDAMGTSNLNRDMNADDLAKWSRTYRWSRENGADGQPRLILDNENAEKPERTEYKVMTDY